MKILQVVPVFSDPFGGPVSVVKSISKELAKRHEVVVYTTTALDPKHDFGNKTEEVDGYKIVYFRRTLRQLCYTDLFGQLNLSIDMIRALRLHLMEFDLVHIHSWQQFPDIMVSQFATKYKIPYILQVHGSLHKITTRKWLKTFYDASFGKRILKKASMVVALSSFEANQYQDYGVSNEEIVIIPNCIDFKEYANLSKKNGFKQKIGMDEKQKMILYLGRLHESKGINVLLMAYARIVEGGHSEDYRLVIAGPDDGYLDELKSIIKSLGLSDSVICTGFLSREDRYNALIAADVFVTPSFYGFPVTFLEACATGTPIVTTTLGDHLDWIDGRVGFVSLPTPPELSRAIISCISDDELHSKFSKNGRMLAKSEFSSKRICRQLDETYKKIVKLPR
jgi:glycosyltransferase involved in cell wall biosynthesis